MISVLIADKQYITSYGLKALVEHAMEGVGVKVELTDTTEALYEKIGHNDYDLLILDSTMFQSEGTMMISMLLSVMPMLKILIVGEQPETNVSKGYFNAGAFGYLQKNKPREEIISAIQKVIKGEHYWSQQLQLNLLYTYFKLDTAVNPNPFEKLSKRETDVVTLMLKGKKQNEICEFFNLKQSTINSYKQSVYHKLGTTNVIEIAKMAQRYGAIEELIPYK